MFVKSYTNERGFMKNDTAVKVTELYKAFDEVQAVNGVSFEIKSGELFGFLGPNGAGKTTTINMLTGLARPDKGSISISGIDCVKNPRAAQDLIGIVPDESNLYPEMTGYENLTFCASLYGIRKKEREKKALELLKTFNLFKAKDRKFSGYSKGMKRKLTIAAGIIHNPKILFLDEPTTGIDVSSARQLRRIVDELHKKGTTIFLTTHYIEEAERLCDRIAFISGGVIVKTDSVSNLLEPVKEKNIIKILCSECSDNIINKLSEAFPNQNFSVKNGCTVYVQSKEKLNIGPLIRVLEDNGIEVFEAGKIRQSLEDVFVEITGIGLDIMQKNKEKSRGGK